MVQASKSGDLKGKDGAVIYRDLAPGVRVRMNDGAIVEVTANPHDGAWLLVRFVEHPKEPSRVGQEDMVFFTDVEALA